MGRALLQETYWDMPRGQATAFSDVACSPLTMAAWCIALYSHWTW